MIILGFLAFVICFDGMNRLDKNFTQGIIEIAVAAAVGCVVLIVSRLRP